MKKPSVKLSSLRKVIGRSHPDVNAVQVKTDMAIVGERSTKRGDNRTVVIERDAFLDPFTPEEAFESIVEKISRVTSGRRQEVENILIATGSKKSVRKMSRTQLNSEIQNRLVDPTEKGEKFRTFLSVMVANDYGKSLMNDGFFRLAGEAKASSNGQVQDPYYDKESGQWIFDQGEESTPFTATPDGGIKQTKNPQQWGSVLSGSAQVINSVGGIIGLFTGGAQGMPNNNVFNTYSQDQMVFQQQQFEQQKRNRNLKIGLFIFGAIAIIVTVIVIAKAQKNKNDK